MHDGAKQANPFFAGWIGRRHARDQYAVRALAVTQRQNQPTRVAVALKFFDGFFAQLDWHGDFFETQCLVSRAQRLVIQRDRRAARVDQINRRAENRVRGLFQIHRARQPLAEIVELAQLIEQARLVNRNRGLARKHGRKFEIPVRERFAPVHAREIQHANHLPAREHRQGQRRENVGFAHHLANFRIERHAFRNHQRLAALRDARGDTVAQRAPIRADNLRRQSRRGGDVQFAAVVVEQHQRDPLGLRLLLNRRDDLVEQIFQLDGAHKRARKFVERHDRAQARILAAQLFLFERVDNRGEQLFGHDRLDEETDKAGA